MTPQEALRILTSHWRDYGTDWVIDDAAFDEKFAGIAKKEAAFLARHPGAKEKWHAFYLRVREQQTKTQQDREMAIATLEKVIA